MSNVPPGLAFVLARVGCEGSRLLARGGLWRFGGLFEETVVLPGASWRAARRCGVLGFAWLLWQGESDGFGWGTRQYRTSGA
jgi:hypothetical protein